MKTVDIGCITNRRIRTLCHFLNYIYRDEYQPKVDVVEEFLTNYIPEAIWLTEVLPGENLKNISEVEFITEKLISESEYIKKLSLDKISKEEIGELDDLIMESDELQIIRNVNSGIYNICGLLVDIDRMEINKQEIMDAMELKMYQETIIAINKMINGLIFVNLGVSNFIMDINRGNKFSFTKHYNLEPDIYNGLIEQKKLQYINLYKDQRNVKESENEDLYSVSNLLLGYDLLIVKQKLAVFKFFLALICIQRSLEYPMYMRMFAEILIDILQEIMFCGSLHRLYVQMKEINTSKPTDERGKEDATTRLSITFSIANDDIFIMRIDFPHKGENFLHINMCESVKGRIVATGYPMEDIPENRIHLRNLTKDKYDKLFFHLNGYIWYKSNFENVLNKLKLREENKKELSKEFCKACHHKIPFNSNNEQQQIEFFNELKEYLACFNISKAFFIGFEKDDLRAYNEIYKVRNCQEIRKSLINAFNETLDAETKGKDFMWQLFKDRGLEKAKLSEKEFKEADFNQCWTFIENLCM
ncbi:hypothetical protein QA584_12675 [Anaerocolumna sp. AGMB13025]|uniref:hypothetical protein n=1 Tax=Anaerocolumna sp. AGMB13025 TaxID=3039116 RepID=UPI00241CE8E8|nr:hypothetical protein [Anaerocolumna sp. AGMB13025]WFR59894.1 hypothetical protein QA584_12675 [Anaerocolumna sp. AGMB13025]